MKAETIKMCEMQLHINYNEFYSTKCLHQKMKKSVKLNNLIFQFIKVPKKKTKSKIRKQLKQQMLIQKQK